MVKCECGREEAYDLSTPKLTLICPNCSTKAIHRVYLRAYYEQERKWKNE